MQHLQWTIYTMFVLNNPVTISFDLLISGPTNADACHNYTVSVGFKVFQGKVHSLSRWGGKLDHLYSLIFVLKITSIKHVLLKLSLVVKWYHFWDTLCISTDFRVHSSSHFPFRAWTQTDTQSQTHTTEQPTHASVTASLCTDTIMFSILFTYFSSFDAKGNSLFFFKSVLAIIATSSPCSFTIGSFPEIHTHTHINKVALRRARPLLGWVTHPGT